MAKRKAKKKRPSRKKTGRKLLDIPEAEVGKLASYGCTNVEIAGFYGCDEGTIRKRFSEILTKGRESGKIRLRKKQYNTAMGGNAPLLIWLGKQMLGQTDKHHEQIGMDDNLVALFSKVVNAGSAKLRSD
jgi:DNA-binding CsgD family transcriptional regulator